MEKTIADHLAKPGAELVVDPVRPTGSSRTSLRLVASLDSPGAVAEQLAATLAITGDIQTLNQLYRRYAEVTPADVQRLARQVLVPSRETKINMVYVAPKEPAPATTDPSATPGGN